MCLSHSGVSLSCSREMPNQKAPPSRPTRLGPALVRTRVDVSSKLVPPAKRDWGRPGVEDETKQDETNRRAVLAPCIPRCCPSQPIVACRFNLALAHIARWRRNRLPLPFVSTV